MGRWCLWPACIARPDIIKRPHHTKPLPPPGLRQIPRVQQSPRRPVRAAKSAAAGAAGFGVFLLARTCRAQVPLPRPQGNGHGATRRTPVSRAPRHRRGPVCRPAGRPVRFWLDPGASPLRCVGPAPPERIVLRDWCVRPSVPPDGVHRRPRAPPLLRPRERRPGAPRPPSPPPLCNHLFPWDPPTVRWWGWGLSRSHANTPGGTPCHQNVLGDVGSDLRCASSKSNPIIYPISNLNE